MSETRSDPPAVGLGSALARYGWLAVLFAIVGVLLAGVYSDRQGSRYTSTTQVRIGAGAELDPTRASRDVTDRYYGAQIDLLNAKSTRLLVEDDPTLSDTDPTFVAEASDRSNDVVMIRGEASTPEGAQKAANAAVAAYSKLRTDEVAADAQRVVAALDAQNTQFRTSLDQLNAAIAEREGIIAAGLPANATVTDRTNAIIAARTTDPVLVDLQARRDGTFTLLQTNNARIAEVNLTAASYQPVSILQAPLLPESPSSPARTRNAMLGGALGLLAGAALAWRAAEIRRSMIERNAALVDAAPVVGSIGPVDSARVELFYKQSDDLAVISDMALGLARRIDVPHPIVVSVHAVADRSAAGIAFNLAAALRMKWPDTALVDGEFDDRVLSTALEVPNDLGLTDFFVPQVSFADCVRPLDIGGSRVLDVVPAGRRWSSDRNEMFFLSDEIDRAVTELKKSYEFTVVSGPTVSQIGTATALAAAADGVVLVVDAEDASGLDIVLEKLRRSGTPVFGLVVRTPLKAGRIRTYLAPIEFAVMPWRTQRM